MSYEPFGGRTDPFGIATSDLILQESSEETDALSRADAQDENGDIAASTWHGNTEGALKTISATYLLKSGALELDTLKLGEITGTPNVVRETIEASTENGDWPKITVSGKSGTQTITAPDGFLNTFTLPKITLTGAKRAQLISFTTAEGCRLTGSSLSASVDLAQVEDGLGEPAAHGLSGGIAEISADFVAVTTAPGWTVTGDFTETQPPGDSEGQAAYHTGSGKAEMVLERDTGE